MNIGEELMLQILIGIFIILHGLVHLWYVTLCLGLVEFQSAMGWTGQSWILSSFISNEATHSVASVFYILATLPFLASGIGIIMRLTWWQPMLLGSAIFSSFVIILFWDGQPQQLVEKGLLGLVINIVIVGAVLFLR